MANITITVQSLLNTAVYDSYTIDNGQTINQLKTAINTARGFGSTWYDIVQNEHIVSGTATLSSLGITTGTQLRTHNKIARLATKELRQKSKLDLAALDRASTANPRATADLTTLPTQYNDNAIVNNPNAGGLIEGRPWIETVSTFTFYEAFGTTSALSTTRYVTGNKIYVYSSSYDVPSYQNANIVVNDIEIYNGTNRGHTLALLDSYGDTISINSYDTYGNAGTLTTLANALNGAASGSIAILTVYDASALNATVRSALTTNYGSTNANTWTANRTDHIFIGIRV
jgi:hypothetical protein